MKEGGGEEKEMRSEGGWKRGGEEKERREAATTIFPSARRPLSLQCRPRPREEEEEEAASSQGRRRCFHYSKCMKKMVVCCWWRMPAGALVSAQTFFHTYTVLYILSLRSLAFSLDQRSCSPAVLDFSASKKYLLYRTYVQFPFQTSDWTNDVPMRVVAVHVDDNCAKYSNVLLFSVDRYT